MKQEFIEKTPAEVLEHRLAIGGSADRELFDRAVLCAAWFDENPEQRLLWLPRLRRFKRNPFAISLWNQIEPILSLAEAGNAE